MPDCGKMIIPRYIAYFAIRFTKGNCPGKRKLRYVGLSSPMFVR